MRKKILMIDDDRELLKMLRTYFEMKNYEIMTAPDGAEALQKAGENPDIILLDVNMPYLDGLEVCRRIRDKVSCPILFLTARVEEEDRVNGLLSGGAYPYSKFAGRFFGKQNRAFFYARGGGSGGNLQQTGRNEKRRISLFRKYETTGGRSERSCVEL